MRELEKLVGRRFDDIDKVKEGIEEVSGRKVNVICESMSERLEGCDFMIDFDFADSDIVQTIFYLKDNANNYYITEV